MGCDCDCHDKLGKIGVLGCCFKCEADHDALRGALSQNCDMRGTLAKIAALEPGYVFQGPHLAKDRLLMLEPEKTPIDPPQSCKYCNGGLYHADGCFNR